MGRADNARAGNGPLRTRPATADDAAAMSAMLQRLQASGKRRSPADIAHVSAHYLIHPDRIACTLAEDADGTLLGFQSLKRAGAGNPYDTPEGWGIIGTHVAPEAARRGVGAALFTTTRAAARAAGIAKIDAHISAENAAALAYYEAMGFHTWREEDGAVGKCFRIGEDQG